MQDYHAHFKANLGQGAPEVGEIPNVPSHITKFEVLIDALKYAPTTGVKAFHHAMANLYNMQYRQPDSLISSLHATPQPAPQDVYCGYQVPEYTTYSEVSRDLYAEVTNNISTYPLF